MNSVERVKMICKEKKIPISRLEKELGFANGYIGQLKKGVFPDDRLKMIVDYLGVPIDDFMAGKETDRSDNSILTESNTQYYIDEETAKTAQEIYDNDKILFDVYKTADKDRLVQYAKKLAELRRLEEGEE